MVELDLPELSKIDLIRLVHLCCCLLGGSVLVLIWFNALKQDKKVEHDWGLILIAFALILWAGMDAYRFLGLMRPGEVSVVLKTFSAYNNAFFLAALPFFTHAFSWVKRRYPFFENGTNWVMIVLLTNVLVVMLYSISWGDSPFMVRFIQYFDIVYSSLTFVALGYAITVSFSRRAYYRGPFVVLGLVVTFALVVTQLPFLPFFRVAHYDLVSLSLLVTHVGLVYLVLVLAQSWVVERKAIADEAENQALRVALAQAKAATASLPAPPSELSDREREVLRHLSKSYAEIGELLFISRDTVITHKKNIEAKLGISGKENLVAYARAQGLED